jgi:hypothetical protein
MSRSRIAFALEEAVLLTIDGNRLLAFDAHSGAAKWTLELERPLFGVAFAPHEAFLRGQSGNPWRIAASGAEAVVVDRAGAVHAVDAGVGRVVGSLEPIGTPVALAGSLDAFACALTDRVVVWKRGDVAPSTIACRPTALAFSRDGKTLAIGSAKGDVRFVSTATLEGSPPTIVSGCVTAIGPRRPGEWVVGTDVAIHHVSASSVRRISQGEAHEVACDATGNLLAVRRGELSVLVYEWWPSAPVTHITSGGRRIDGIAFGASDRLALGLDRGEASVVDLASGIALSTSDLASGALYIESETAHVSRTSSVAERRLGVSRLGLGGFMSLMLVLVCVGYCSSSTHQTWVPTPAFLGESDYCGEVCERDRLLTLRSTCETHDCGAFAEEAQAAYDLEDCLVVKTALSHIPRTDVTVSRQAEAAERGLVRTCDPHMLPPPKSPPAIVHLVGGDLVEEVESTPLAGDDPRALYVAENGTVFLATIVRSGRCAIRRKTAADGWRASTESLDCRAVALYGRAANDVYAGLGSTIRHFDGARWVDLAFLGEEVRSIAGDPKNPAVIYVVDRAGAIRSHRAGVWVEEPIRGAQTATSVFAGSSRVWAQGTPGDVLLQRGTNAEWTSTTRTQRGETWAAPDGTIFSAYGTTITAVRDGIPSEDIVPAFVDHLWGRTRVDVYAGGPSGLIHYDGITWTNTSFSGRVRALAGNATDLYVVADR